MKGPPKCACNSGKVYEDCCYKIVLANGKRKYDYGQGVLYKNQWYPVPNSRIKAIIHLEVKDEHTVFADNWLLPKLTQKQSSGLRHELEQYHKSLTEVKFLLKTPLATNISTVCGSPQLRGCWRSHLMNSRTLLDYLGLLSKSTLEFTQDIGGFSKKKLPNLINQLDNIGQKDKSEKLSQIAPILLKIIELRNHEKSNGTTIMTPPVISPDGNASGGQLITGISDMVDFMKQSENAIGEFLNLILK